jgi:hypothetical protein
VRTPPSALALGGLVFLGVVLGLVVAEVGVRVYEAGRGPRRADLGIDDPIRHHRWRANAHGKIRGVEYATNSLGLRDREFAPVAPPGALRILMLGDSFTEGWTLPVEGVVAKRLEQLLTARCRRVVEVINGGTASYSPLLQYLLLREIGPQLKPDLVVLNFDMTDVHDDFVRKPLARFDAGGLPVAVPANRRVQTAILMPPLGPSPVLRALDPIDGFLKFSILYQRLRRSRAGQSALGALNMTPERLAELGLIGDIQYDVLAITRDGTSPGLEAAWADTRRYIVGIRDLARRQGAAFALVVYPHAHQVSATASPGGRRKFGMSPGLYSSEAPFRVLEELGRRQGFPVINLKPHFKAAVEAQERDGTPSLYWLHDIHLTVHGALVFARGIEEGLRREGFLQDCH